MRDKIENIIKKYYDVGDEYYRQHFYDDDDNEFSIDGEIKNAFEQTDFQHSVVVEDCFDSCGYSCSMLIIAWIENGKLETANILLECM